MVVSPHSGGVARRGTMTKRLPVLALATSLVLGGTAVLTSAAGAQGISKKAAAKQYLALVNPTNAALVTFGAEAKQWVDSTPDAEAEADAKPVIASFMKLEAGLIDDRWPSGSRADVKAMVKSIAPVTGDLQSLATLNLLNASTWINTFERDVNGVKTSVAFVRHDLGLPATKSS
jgi:hypothetical protein